MKKMVLETDFSAYRNDLQLGQQTYVEIVVVNLDST